MIVSNLPEYNTKTVGADAARFARAHTFIQRMKRSMGTLTPQQFRTLRGQALAGDVAGAEKGYEKLMSAQVWRYGDDLKEALKCKGK